MKPMTQTAPHPVALYKLVDQIEYRGGWAFSLEDLDRGQGSEGLTLIIRVVGPDAYNPERRRGVLHYMPVPPAAYDERAWRRWLLEQVLLVERHETCEFFQIDGERPYAPNHGPGRDPYTIHERGTDEDAATPAARR
jgi:hypothetical protein